MPKPLKFIKFFSNYIAEQELDDSLGGEGSVAKPKEQVYSFLFIEEGENGDYRYPDGSSSKRFPTYQISKPGLDKWLDTNIKSADSSESAAKVKRKSISEYVEGKKVSITPDDKEIIIKFKNSVITRMIGKKIQDTEVVFPNGDGKNPSTDEIDVTFIIIPKK